MTEHTNTTVEHTNPTTGGNGRTFRRSRDDRVIAGVCGGAATLLGIDAAIVRIAVLVTTLLGFGTGALLYLACWLVVPEES